MMEKKRTSKGWIWGVIVVLLAVGGGLVAAKRELIYDYYRGITYRPSAEMSRIRDDLKLTERGEFLFGASQPRLSESEEFNAVCRTDGETESAVLGCYTGGDIYIYNIESKELDGIRELTTAHELLHAVWDRMDDGDRRALEPDLSQVLADNQDLLRDELAEYDASERQEELYVRAGTEVMNLPDALEKHYAEIFRDQGAVVAFYNKYIGVFNRLQTELDSLALELESISNEIERRTSFYESEIEQLNADITSFNNCADTAGCFNTENEFYAQRAQLISRQDSLEVTYNEISALIDDYNAKVEIYNADVVQSEKLNTLINSNKKPNNIE